MAATGAPKSSRSSWPGEYSPFVASLVWSVIIVLLPWAVPARTAWAKYALVLLGIGTAVAAIATRTDHKRAWWVLIGSLLVVSAVILILAGSYRE